MATLVLSLALLILSAFLLEMHRRSWQRATANTSLPANEQRYALSQYRRRMQASGIIGVLGVAIGCRSIVPRDPFWLLIYLASILGACMAIVVLAAIDAWATRQYYARLRSENMAAQVKLVRELDVKTQVAGDVARR